jgi:hypothetical protein
MNVTAGSFALPNGFLRGHTARTGSNKLVMGESLLKRVIRSTVDTERSQPVLRCQALIFRHANSNEWRTLPKKNPPVASSAGLSVYAFELHHTNAHPQQGQWLREVNNSLTCYAGAL